MAGSMQRSGTTGKASTRRNSGRPPPSEGSAFFSIRRRLMAFNGSLQIESAPREGTVIKATLPSSLDRSQVMKSEVDSLTGNGYGLKTRVL
jgi:hypothetical protein